MVSRRLVHVGARTSLPYLDRGGAYCQGLRRKHIPASKRDKGRRQEEARGVEGDEEGRYF
jgi:hypothetical protein